jgi:hypothetical protein
MPSKNTESIPVQTGNASTASIVDQAVEAMNLLSDDDKLKVVAYIQTLERVASQ